MNYKLVVIVVEIRWFLRNRLCALLFVCSVAIVSAEIRPRPSYWVATSYQNRICGTPLLYRSVLANSCTDSSYVEFTLEGPTYKPISYDIICSSSPENCVPTYWYSLGCQGNAQTWYNELNLCEPSNDSLPAPYGSYEFTYGGDLQFASHYFTAYGPDIYGVGCSDTLYSYSLNTCQNAIFATSLLSTPVESVVYSCSYSSSGAVQITGTTYSDQQCLNAEPAYNFVITSSQCNSYSGYELVWYSCWEGIVNRADGGEWFVCIKVGGEENEICNFVMR